MQTVSADFHFHGMKGRHLAYWFSSFASLAIFAAQAFGLGGKYRRIYSLDIGGVTSALFCDIFLLLIICSIS